MMCRTWACLAGWLSASNRHWDFHWRLFKKECDELLKCVGRLKYMLNLNCVMSARGRTINYIKLHMMCGYYLALMTYHVGLWVYSDKCGVTGFTCARQWTDNSLQLIIPETNCFCPSCFDSFRYTFCECIPGRYFWYFSSEVSSRPYNLDMVDRQTHCPEGFGLLQGGWSMIHGQEYAQLYIDMLFSPYNGTDQSVFNFFCW
jgi:hypothetical protein